MKINFIQNTRCKHVTLKDESYVFSAMPNLPKDMLPMYNYWDEIKRGDYLDTAKLRRLVLDYDSGISSTTVMNTLSEYEYIFYHSSGNSGELEKFRIILKLKDPIIASDLKIWRAKLAKEFNGIDTSSFAIGRFFYVPSRYDKDGNDIKVIHHKGSPYDFYKTYRHIEYNEMFERLKAKMAQRSFGDYDKDDGPEVLRAWSDDKSFHYPDLFGFCIYARRLKVSPDDALEIFMSRYAGHSDIKKCFQKTWDAAGKC